MLISNIVEVKINNRNKSHFEKLKYEVNNKLIIVKVSDLMEKSRTIIECSCDKCESVKKMTYQNYNRFTKFGKENYYCIKCSPIKNIATCLLKYGVDHYSKTDDFKENNKKIWLENLGVDHPSKSDKIKEKTKQTWMRNLGVEHPSKLKKVTDKTKKTNIFKYGVDHPMQSQELKDKIRNYNISTGRWHNHDITLYKGYRKIINRMTKFNKKILFENWNGFDYYDGEYIRDNFDLNPNDKNYPTIDHKISVLNGYLNNISTEEISSLNNLCVTKLCINSSKNYKNECDFKL